MKKKTTAKAAKPLQSAIKSSNRKTLLKQTGLKTQINGHLKANNQRKQAKRDSRG